MRPVFGTRAFLRPDFTRHDRMLSKLSSLFIAPLLVFAAANEDAGTYTILHRTFGPGVSEQQFLPRATLDVATLQLTPIPGETDEFERIYEASRGFESAMYQLALMGPDEDPLGERLDISSVKAVSSCTP